jgi:hypothetical protein
MADLLVNKNCPPEKEGNNKESKATALKMSNFGIHFWPRVKHLREWLFHSRTGVGVRNSLGAGVGANNLLGVDLGVDFYCLNFALALAYISVKGTR